MRRPLFAVTLLLVAVVWIKLAAGGYDSPPAGKISVRQLTPQQTLYVTGQVYQKEEQKIWLKSVTIILSEEAFQQTESLEQNIPCIENIICELEEDTEDIPLGRNVAVSGIFVPFSRASNPGEFDSESYYRSLEAGGRLRKAVVEGQDESCWKVREWLLHRREALHNRLYKLFPEQEATVMCTLLLGERSDLDGDTKGLYKRNGILHILSISSLHITLIGMSLYRLLRKAGIPIPVAAVAGGAALLFYGMMTGFGVSACRAIAMYLIRMGAEVCGRTYDLLTALGIAAAGMVIKNPYYLLNSGFLLSFASVLGIGVLYPALAGKDDNPVRPRYYGEKTYWLWLRKFRKNLKNAFGASLSITLVTLPIQLWFYYEIPVYSVFLNLLVIPLLKPLLAAGFFCLFPGAGAAGIVDRLALVWIQCLCKFFDRFPGHTWNPGRPALWQVLLYYLLLIGVVLGRKKLEEQVSQSKSKQNDKGCEGKERQAKVRKRNEVWQKIGWKIQKKGEADKVWRKLRQMCRDWKKVWCGFWRKNGNWQGGRAECVHYQVRLWLLEGGALLAAVFILGVRPEAQNRILFLDVGQGDCCLIRTAAGENYLFDCGSSSRSSVGKYIFLPCLKYYGIHTLDGIFLSHPDTDHMNGILEFLQLAEENGIQVRQLILPGIEKQNREREFGEVISAVRKESSKRGSKKSSKRGSFCMVQETRIAYLSAGESWKSGGASFLCLHPAEGDSAEDANVYSMCIYGEFGDYSLLLTGDVEGSGEQALTEELVNRGISKVTLLKVAHHGSRYSTSQEFLRQVQPQAAVISCGKSNRYGHPHQELLERLEEAETLLYKTSECGAIYFYIDEKGLWVEKFGER